MKNKRAENGWCRTLLLLLVLFFLGTGLLEKPVSSYAKTEKVKAASAVKMEPGYYYLTPKAETSKVLETKKASLLQDAVIGLHAKGTAASRVWQVESAGGKKIRIKNVNSGLYLGVQKKEKATANRVVQKKYDKKDKTIVFEVVAENGKYTGIRCKANNQYLYVSGTKVRAGAGEKLTGWKFRWTKTTCPASSFKLSSAVYPQEQSFGQPFSIVGKVKAHYVLTWLCVRILDSSGNVVQSAEITVDALTADLTAVDADIKFGKLEVGSYRYQIMAKDSKGTQKKLLDKAFTVSVPTVTGAASIPYEASLITEIGHQSAGTALEKKACASFALAYCHAILTGTAVSPHSYWLSATTVDCVWSKGSYQTTSFSSEKAVLQEAYAQISTGYPCILHVTGSTEQHWVTLVGFKNVTSLTELTTSNFTAIDPWDGMVFTLSDRYKVKSTYRIATKSGT